MSEHILLAIIGVLALMIVGMVCWFHMRFDRKLDQLTTKFDAKFDRLDDRLGAVEQAVANLNGRVERATRSQS